MLSNWNEANMREKDFPDKCSAINHSTDTFYRFYTLFTWNTSWKLSILLMECGTLFHVSVDTSI